MASQEQRRAPTNQPRLQIRVSVKAKPEEGPGAKIQKPPLDATEIKVLEFLLSPTRCRLCHFKRGDQGTGHLMYIPLHLRQL